MTYDLLTLAQLALIIVFGYTVFGLTGFGSSVTAMPLLVLFIPLRMAVPLMLVFDLVSNVLLGLKNRRFIDKREALRLIPFMLAGMAVGVLALVRAPERTLLVVLGLFILAYSAWSLLSRRKPPPLASVWAGPFGVVGGMFTALFGTGGPFYTIFLTSRLDDKRTLRATLSGVLFFIPTEYDLARESAVPLARRLHAEGMRVYLSGHSLGGGIAQSIAYQLEPELGVEAFTFDTSPVTNWTRLNADHLVKNTDPKIYRVFMNKEALENLRSFTTKFNTLRFGRSDYEFNFVNKPPVDAHSMSHLACQMAARVSAGGAEHDYPQASARRLLGKTYLCDPKSVSIDPQLMAAGN